MHPLILILGLVAALCGIVLLLEVRSPQTVIAIGLMAAGLGLVAVAT